MLKILSLVLILGCLPVACTTEEASIPEAAAGIVGVRHAMCGCSIEGIDACGNYVQIEGEYVKLVHDSLGPMQFCEHKKDGVDITIAGDMKDGEFIAQSWEVVK